MITDSQHKIATKYGKMGKEMDASAFSMGQTKTFSKKIFVYDGKYQ